MKNNFKKIISLLLIIGMNWSAISLIAGTDAYFNDTETSENNTLTAGILDFELTGDNFTLLASNSTRTVKMNNFSSLPFEYQITIKNVSAGLCGDLNLIAEMDGSEMYNGAIAENQVFPLTLPLPILNPGEDKDWNFTAAFIGSGTPTGTCSFDFEYNGWQDNMDYGAGGFSDTEEISNTITAGEIGEHLLITKVYYDPDDDHKGENSAQDYEWIEIYNPTGAEVNLSDNWQICDNAGCDDLNSIIPSGKFAVITPYADTWNYWNIPDNVIKIELGSWFGSHGLHNDDGDSVILKDINGEVNAMSYFENGIAAALPWSCADVEKGHMLGRMKVVEVWEDTNTSDDWQDLGLPTVEVIYPSAKYIVWKIGSDYDITWSALNMSATGDDSDLTIDIYYSNDSGYSWANIVMGTENDGKYNWTVPWHLDGYSTLSSNCRIKIIATDYTKNFMLSSWDMSNHDFCPPVDCDLLTPELMNELVELGILEGSECDFSDYSGSTGGMQDGDNEKDIGILGYSDTGEDLASGLPDSDGGDTAPDDDSGGVANDGTADGEEGGSGNDGDNPPVTDLNDEEMKGEGDDESDENGGNPANDPDGDDTDDEEDIRILGYSETDEEEPASDFFSPREDGTEQEGSDDGATDDDSSITDDLADVSDDSGDGEVVDDGGEVDMPLPITNDFDGDNGGDGDGDGGEPAPDSSSDGSASEVE